MPPGGLGEAEPVERLDAATFAGWFDLRPSPRSMERFSRLAFFDLDRTRRRDPEWMGAFDSYTLTRGPSPTSSGRCAT